MKYLPGVSLLSMGCLLAGAVLFVCNARALAQQDESEVTPAVQRLYAEASAATENGDSAGAIEKYRSIIKLAPHLAAAYNNLGVLYFNQHDFAHAAEVLKRGLELNPDMPTATAMLGMSYVQLGA